MALRDRASFARLDKLKLVLQNRRCFQWWGYALACHAGRQSGQSLASRPRLSKRCGFNSGVNEPGPEGARKQTVSPKKACHAANFADRDSCRA